ncbi:MAG: adenosylcobinamide-GDP ribazoletransferase [Candidatus Melainabacteria bacterium]|nr:adenosylcobinamide-GDP ribazoletransferase [Candidatus Melainabacteria bacterium]
MRKLIHRFFYAWLFLTRLPAPPLPKATKEDWGRIIPYFVIIGFLIGFLLTLFAILLNVINLPVLMSSLLVVLMWVLLTGGLHMDGLMDTFDGIGCTDPKRKTEALKDSRIGAFGAMGGIFVILFKLTALTTVFLNGLYFVILFSIPVARLTAVYSLCFLNKRNDASRGSSFIAEGAKKPFDFLFNLSVLVVVSLVYLFFVTSIFKWWTLLLIVLSFLISLIFAHALSKYFEGHSGDTYGALIELSEVTFLILAIILRSGFIGQLG